MINLNRRCDYWTSCGRDATHEYTDSYGDAGYLCAPCKRRDLHEGVDLPNLKRISSVPQAVFLEPCINEQVTYDCVGGEVVENVHNGSVINRVMVFNSGTVRLVSPR